MSKVQLLLNVVEDMRSLTDSLQAVANAMMQSEPDEPSTPPKKEPAQTVTVSLEKVRACLGQKSREGYTDAVRGLLQQFGATKLSEIDPKDYETLMKLAEELSNGA